MVIHYAAAKLHWNYFLAIERDFETVARYIEPCEANNNAFSLELARLIMASSQEVDVVMKLLCELLVPGSNANGINAYFLIIREKLPDFMNEEIRIPRFSMSSRPWIDWNESQPPSWWQANNKIKHRRSSHFDQATLKNAFNSLGGLLVTVAYYYNREKTGGHAEAHWPDVTETLVPTATMFRLNQNYYPLGMLC